MKLCVISGNERKLEELNTLLAPHFEIFSLKQDFPEIQHGDQREIAKQKALYAAGVLKKTVLVEDSGMFVNALHGFPGAWTKYAHATIGNRGILKLMGGVKDRTVYYKSAIAICAQGKVPVCFQGVERGTIATRMIGTKGWGQDPIFIPDGQTKTYGQLGYPDGIHPFRRIAVEALVRCFKK